MCRLVIASLLRRLWVDERTFDKPANGIPLLRKLNIHWLTIFKSKSANLAYENEAQAEIEVLFIVNGRIRHGMLPHSSAVYIHPLGTRCLSLGLLEWDINIYRRYPRPNTQCTNVPPLRRSLRPVGPVKTTFNDSEDVRSVSAIWLVDDGLIRVTIHTEGAPASVGLRKQLS